ncbi:hypothetical protein WJX74_000411 [Apatococcus lobatus]|uniref:Uncharacterized protein n=1 Tax=Apatococcus lobatus TaxID=904363 RepID=A0AAW1RNR7_9CHLO
MRLPEVKRPDLKGSDYASPHSCSPAGGTYPPAHYSWVPGLKHCRKHSYFLAQATHGSISLYNAEGMMMSPKQLELHSCEHLIPYVIDDGSLGIVEASDQAHHEVHFMDPHTG